MDNIEKRLTDANDAVQGVYADLVTRRIRRRYTVSDELAILRQRDEKPDEYAAYYAYCEACKADARAEIEAAETPEE